MLNFWAKESNWCAFFFVLASLQSNPGLGDGAFASQKDTIEIETLIYSEFVQVKIPRKLFLQASQISLDILVVENVSPPPGHYPEKIVFDYSPEEGLKPSFRQVQGYLEIGLEKLEQTKVTEQIMGCEPNEWKALARIADPDLPSYLKKYAAFGCILFH